MGRQPKPRLSRRILAAALLACLPPLAPIALLWRYDGLVIQELQIDHNQLIIVTMVGAAVWAITVISIGIWWATAPLRRLNHTFHQLDAGDPTRRLDGKLAPHEVADLADGINDLLAEHQAVIERERNFAAQVGHELRTPIAGIRSEVDVTRQRERSPQEYAQSLQLIGEQVRTMGDTIEQLLRMSAGHLSATTAMRTPFKLADLMHECWRPYAAAADQRRLTISWTIPSTLVIIGRRHKLHIIFGNLFANAQRYTNNGGRIDVLAQRLRGGGAMLRIANSGSQIDPKDLPYLTQRYWRGQHSDDGGYGLGLHMVARLVEATHSELRLSSELGGTFVVEITLPSHLVAAVG